MIRQVTSIDDADLIQHNPAVAPAETTLDPER